MTTLDVKRQGYLRRLKTQKRRYFVLRTLSTCGKPRLEYYESEKKFRTNCPPKRVIQLASCFNIAQKDDTKHDFVFVLYTRDDVFGLICESKADLQSWLDALLNEQTVSASPMGNDYLSDNVGDVELPVLRRDYLTQSVPRVSSWPVTVKPRGLGTSKNLAGTYNLKLVDHTLSLHKTTSEEVIVDFHLTMVRRCGHTDCFFFMEVGRSSVTGAGELWMQVDDPILAQHLHEVVLMAIHTLSSDGSCPSISSQSRYRCHSGGHKPRPSSLLLLTPPRSRSDTSPDSADGPSSPTKQSSEQNSPSGSKRSAMFHRLWSAGKRKSEVLDFSPRLFSRRTQSKSLSIDPMPGGLLGRAQSMDFSSLFGGSHLPSSPETPDSPRERDMSFEIGEPQRTSSNSSGSSGRSWDQSSLPRKPSFDEGRDSGTLTPSSRPSEVPDEGYDTSTPREDNTTDDSPTLDGSRVSDDDTDDKLSRDEKTLKRETHEHNENGEEVADKSEEGNNLNKNVKQVGISQRNRSGYEDMSGNTDCVTIEESIEESDIVNDEQESKGSDSLLERGTLPLQSSPIQRRTSVPARSGSPILEQVQLQAKSSPKQRRTSEPICAITNEFRELVTIKNSPSSSPRRSRKGTLPIANGTIMEDWNSPDPSSPSQSPRGRRRGNDNDEYEEMFLLTKLHTYVNLNPKEGYKPEKPSAYMNFRPRDSPSTPTENEASKAEEHSTYMNFWPGDSPSTPTENEGSKPGEYSAYMNVKPGDSQSAQTESKEHDYMNFRPRDRPSTPTENEASKPEENSAHMNVKPGDSLSAQTESKEHDYMNFKPGQTAEEPSVDGSPSYVNFQPGNSTIARSEPSCPRQKHKHTYENLNLNGTLKNTSDSEFCDYMNVSPRRYSTDKVHSNRNSFPSRGLIFGKTSRFRRRESEPVNMGLMSDEENGMLFLDFSQKKSSSSKGLNYISLDLSKKEKSAKGSPKKKPSELNTTDYHTRSWDIGPKSAPLAPSSYAEIDFTKSHGLRQAIIDHKKTKSLKE